MTRLINLWFMQNRDKTRLQIIDKCKKKDNLMHITESI